MSKISSSSSDRNVAGLLLSQFGVARQKLSAHITKDLAGQVAALESLSDDKLTAVTNVGKAATTSLQGAIQLACEDYAKDAAVVNKMVESLNGSTAALEAAAIVLMAGAKPKDYLEAERVAEKNIGNTISVDFSSPSISSVYSRSHALESFGETDVDSHIDMSVAYNFSAVQQDEFSSLFYPPIVGTPDQVYWRVIARRPSLTYGAQHKAGGEVTAYVKHNLLDAFRLHQLLENDDTRMVPYKNPDNSQAAYFMTGVTADPIKVRGLMVPTAPMKFGSSIDLKGLCSHPDLIAQGVITQVDKINTGVIMSAVYMEISDGTNTSVVKVPTARMNYSQFNQVREGRAEQTELNFRVNDFVLSASTAKDVAGVAIPALSAAGTGEQQIQLKFSVNGDLHLETGELNIDARPVSVVRVVDGLSNDLGAAPASLSGVTFKLVGFDLNARWLNAGRRTVGLLLDSDELIKNYYVPTLAPISLQRPVTSESAARDNQDLITATHALMCNMAVSSLLGHIDYVRDYYNKYIVVANERRTPDWTGVQAFAGVGALFMVPFFEEINIDLEEVLGNLKSKDKMADIRGFFVALINELGYRMVTESGYLVALREVSGDMKAKPKLLIGTDTFLPTFLFINGDDRVTGPTIDYEMASTYDERLRNKIVVSLAGLPAQNQINVLGHGNMLYIPELIATVPMYRSGNTVKETMVQPRFRFIENLPAIAVINVTNVDKVAQQRIKIDNNSYVVNASDLVQTTP